jgi:hypothetical protein
LYCVEINFLIFKDGLSSLLVVLVNHCTELFPYIPVFCV